MTSRRRSRSSGFCETSIGRDGQVHGSKKRPKARAWGRFFGQIAWIAVGDANRTGGCGVRGCPGWPIPARPRRRAVAWLMLVVGVVAFGAGIRELWFDGRRGRADRVVVDLAPLPKLESVAELAETKPLEIWVGRRWPEIWRSIRTGHLAIWVICRGRWVIASLRKLVPADLVVARGQPIPW